MGLFNNSQVRAVPVFLTACMTLASVQPLLAMMACPVRLSDGKMDRGTIGISFMNSGKTPIRQLTFDCTSLQDGKALHEVCHTEAGVFYPGTPYTVHFANTGKASKSIEVSVQSLRLQDGTVWTSSQDQPCSPLKIVQK